jgi:hypothetical protein
VAWELGECVDGVCEDGIDGEGRGHVVVWCRVEATRRLAIMRARGARVSGRRTDTAVVRTRRTACACECGELRWARGLLWRWACRRNCTR